MQERLIRRSELQQRLGVSKATIYNWLRAGVIPAPRRFGPRVIGWPESVVIKLVRGGTKKAAKRPAGGR